MALLRIHVVCVKITYQCSHFSSKRNVHYEIFQFRENWEICFFFLRTELVICLNTTRAEY